MLHKLFFLLSQLAKVRHDQDNASVLLWCSLDIEKESDLLIVSKSP